MPRPLRIEFEGAVHHVMARGNARQQIFLDDRDRGRFLKRLAENVETHEINLYQFCLMDNHFHLVLETPRANLGRFMQALQTAYATYFNLRHDRVGHVMQGRYRAQLVSQGLYLMRLSRYVHLNPVFTSQTRALPLTDRVEQLRQYRWSSYRSYVGLAARLPFVAYGPVLAELAPTVQDPARQAELYRELVEGGLARTDEEFARLLKASPRSLGGDRFRRWVDGLYRKLLGRHGEETSAPAAGAGTTVDPDQALDVVARQLRVAKEQLGRRQRGSMARPIAAHVLCKHCGMTRQAAAEALGLTTGAAVTAQLRALRTALDKDPKLAETLATIESLILGSDPKIRMA